MFRARLAYALTAGMLAVACEHSVPATPPSEVGLDSAEPSETGAVDSTVEDSTVAIDSSVPPDSFELLDTYTEPSCDGSTTKYVGTPAADAGLLDTGTDADADADAGTPCAPIATAGFTGLFGAGDTLYATNDCLYQSTDASTWKRLPLPPGNLTTDYSGDPRTGYVVSRGKLWALTWVGLTAGPAGWTETLGLWRLDGASWTFVSRPLRAQARVFGGGDEGLVINYDTNEVYADVGSYRTSHLLSSTDGVSFTDTIALVIPSVIGSGLTILGDGHQTVTEECDFNRVVIARSSDGMVWTKAKTTPTPFFSVDYGGVARHADNVAAFGLQRTTKQTLIAVSTDGGSTFRLEIDTRAFNGIAAGGSTFVMVGEGGVIVTSSDLTKPWTARTSGTSARLTNVAAFGTGFVAVAPRDGSAPPVVLQSPDGTTWTAKSITPLDP